MAEPDVPIALAALASDAPLEARLASVAQALSVAADTGRAPLLLELAANAILAGQRDRALDALRDGAVARGGPHEVDLELTTALVALELGDALRTRLAAERALALKPSAAATRLAHALQLRAVMLDRTERAPIRSAPEQVEDASGVALRLSLAALALDAGDRALCERHLKLLAGVKARTGLLACELDSLRAGLELASGAAAGARAARGVLSRSVWQLIRLGAPRRLGLAYMLMARVEADETADHTAAAAWLARAQPLLVRAANPRDQEALRRAFRAFGRRQVDRLVDEDLGAAIDALRASHARLGDVLAAAEDARDAGTDALGAESDALGELSAAAERVIGALEGVVVDRERVGQLVRVAAQLSRADGAGAIVEILPRLALELCAGDGAELWEIEEGRAELRCTSRRGAGLPVSAPRVEREIRDALEDGQARLLGLEQYAPRSESEDDSGGRFAVVRVPLARGQGALVVGRAARGGRISTSDLERLTVFASLAAASLDRARNAEALAEAALRDAATLEAIRDGIMTLDVAGAIRSMNRAAARLLAVERERALGSTLQELGLAAIAPSLAAPSDGDVVSLPHGDVLVRSRSYGGGVVATLQELQSAQRMAHRLVGSGARFTFEDLVGADRDFLAALEDARRAARTDVPLLVTGESGTGKEMLAQAIHNASPRASAPFVGINVAAIPRELLESELFGYERGAFTGARSGGMVGKLELAGEGTVLLDEIGDMPWEMQAKLLRVLQERTVVRLGGTREVPIRARIIATTHRDLDVAVREGTFRLDLFYRLRGVHLRLPALRERRADVPALVEHCLAIFCAREQRPAIRVAPAVMRELEAYPWPGNVRELANLIDGHASLLPPEARSIDERPRALERALDRGSTPAQALSSRPPSAEVLPLTEVEKRVFAHALAHFGGNVARASRALGVSRGTFYNKMKSYGLGEG